MALTNDNASWKCAWELRAKSWDWGSLYNGRSKSAFNKKIEPMLGPLQLCQLSGWKFSLLTAGCLRNKNVLKLEAELLEKIRTF